MMQSTTALILRFALIVTQWGSGSAFGVPQPFLSHLVGASTTIAFVPPSSLVLSEGDIVEAAFSTATSAADAAVSAVSAPETSSLMDTLYNVAIGITAIVFAFAGLTFIIGSIVIPAASRELEKECLELAPEWWDEYQAKLKPGETMATRPDLMQELGAKLQPLLDAKIAESQQRQQQRATTANTESYEAVDLSSLKDQWDDEGDDDIVDAEILSKDEKNT